MSKKRMVVIPNDLYIYSTNHLAKYKVLLIIMPIIAVAVAITLYYHYIYIPEESVPKNTISIENSKNIIANDNGIYYTGNFTTPPQSIDLDIGGLENARETLYLYLFNDNHIFFWKFYKNDNIRDFHYVSFNLVDKDINNLAIKEANKTFLDFYDNFTKVRFNKNVGSLYLELPSFNNIDSDIEFNIEDTLVGSFDFSFEEFYASMVNWSKNKAFYIANAYGKPSGNITIPGHAIELDDTSDILSYYLIGDPPYRYSHNLTAALIYIQYDINPVPVFIYTSKPFSKNSNIIRFFYKNQWHTYTNFDVHSYEESTDYYSREDGFSFIFAKDNHKIESKSGTITHYISKVEEGTMEGYLTLNNNKINFRGIAIKEYMRSVN